MSNQSEQNRTNSTNADGADEDEEQHRRRQQQPSGVTMLQEEDNEDVKEDEEDIGAAAAVVAAALNNENIGYCHVCDKQVPIDMDSFTCSECHGGFIELFENEAPRQAGQQQQPQQANTQQDAPLRSIRLTSDPNFNNLSNLLPMLLPQLLAGAGIPQPSQMPSQQQQQQQQPSSSNITFTTNMPGMGSTPPMAQRIGPTTRLQFIVPGEQFDLYGVINNVLNDLLDPRRMQGGGGVGGGGFAGPFNFQPPPIRMFQLHGDLRDYAWGATGLDTIITQLLNQLENTGPPPASEQQIDNLPLVRITQEEFDKNVQCSICMEDFKVDDEAKKLPCKHYFHPSCILEWLKLHGTCPVCRKNLNGEDTSQREYISRPPTTTTSATSQTDSSSQQQQQATTSSSVSNDNPAQVSSSEPSVTSTTRSSDTHAAQSSEPSDRQPSSNRSNQQAPGYYEPDFD